tara:strand:+ start:410 stop:1342 length:933 start_codon:yes stop_codon:yes gene_type:complete
MFSVVFPGQGSQTVGMSNEFYSKFELFKKIYKEADDILGYSISKLILEGPVKELNLTQNTQPAIFLVSYSIFRLINEEFNIDLSKAKFFTGHSLGEYSALCCAGLYNFETTLRLLKSRGLAMQNAVPEDKGGMVAILGSDINTIEQILDENKKEFECYIANDNSNFQIIISGLNEDLDKCVAVLNRLKIKNMRLPVSAPFHCKLMNAATETMKKILLNTEVNDLNNKIISNVTASEVENKDLVPELLISQINSKVRWRESIEYMINKDSTYFIEIGPGKVLSNLIKRINKTVKTLSINFEEDIKQININD